MTNLAVAVKITADASQAAAGFAQGTAAVKQYADATSQAAAAATTQADAAARSAEQAARAGQQQAAEAQRSAEQATRAGQQQAAQAQGQAQTRAAGLDQLAEAERRYAQTLAETNRQLAAREIDDKQAQATLVRAKREMDGYREAVDRQGGAARESSYRNKQLALQLSDTFQTLALGMPIQMVLLQQGPQIIDLYGGMGVALKALVSPIGLAVAGLVGLGAAGAVLVGRLEGAERALNQAQVGLLATGRSAELSRGQLQTLTDSFARLPGASRAGAEEAAAALSRMRQVSTEMFGDIGAAASKFMVLTGEDFPAATNSLAELLKAPTEGAKKFADTWGGLSVAQLDAIESMERSGNRLGAQRELFGAIQGRLQDLAKVGKTEIQQAADTMGKSWDDMLTSLSRTGPIEAARDALISMMRGVAEAASDPDAGLTAVQRWQKRVTQLDGQASRGGPNAAQSRLELGQARQALALAQSDELEARRGTAMGRVGMPAGAANDNGLPDPTKIRELIGSYDDLTTRRKALMDQMTLLSRAAGQEGVDQDALSRAVQNLYGQYEALKDPVDKARDALTDEQRVAAASIGTRQVLQAQLQAERQALDAGQPAWKARELGQIAAAQAAAQLSTAARDQVALTDAEAQGALTVASAYGQSARAAHQAAIAEEARQAAVKSAFVNEQALTQVLTDRAAAQATLDGSKAVAELQEQVAAAERLAEAEKAGAEAVNEVAIANEVAAYALQLRATETDATRAANDKLIASYEQLVRRQDAAGRSAANSQALRARQEQIELAEAELRLVGALPAEHDRQIDRLRTIQDLRRRGIDLTSEQAQAELRQTDQLSQIQAQIQQARNAAAETNRIWDQAAGNIQDALSDAFNSAMDRSKQGGFDAAQTLLRIFRSVAAEITAAMVIKPAIGSVAGLLGAPQSWLAERGYGQVASAATNIPQSAMSWMNPFGSNPFGIAGGFSNIMTPGAGWLGSMFPSVFGAGFAPVLGLEAGAASMGAAGLGLGAAEAAALGAGAAPGMLAGMSGILSAGLPIAAAIAIPLLTGMFADKQTPRGYAASEIRTDGKFIASTQHQAGLDGYDNSRDRQQAAAFAAMMNSTMQRLGLDLAVSRDSINGNGANNGLLTIGTMYGGAASAEELFLRWFTRNQNQAAGATDTSETAWMQASGYSRSGTYDRDTGWTYTLTDGTGAAVTQEMWTKAYDDWVKAQAASSQTGTGTSLFAANDNQTLQLALDRMAAGSYKPADAEELGKSLDFAAGFEDQAARAAAGVGTLQRQVLEFELAARDAAKALNTQVKDYLDQATKIFGEGSTQAKDAQQTQLQSVLGQMGIGPNVDDKPLEGLAATISQTVAGFAAMAPVLVTLGKSTEEATSLIAQATTTYKAKVATDYNKSISDQILSIKAPEKLAWAQLAEAQEKQYKEAQAAGADMVKLAELQGLQTQALFDQLAAQRQARLDTMSMRVYAVDSQLNPANTRANEDAVRRIQQRREAEEMTRGLEQAEAALLRQRLSEIHAAEDAAVAMARLEEDRQKAEGYMARSANAIAGVLAGNDQAKALAEDVSRALAQAQELRQVRTEEERTTLRQIHALENQAAAAQRLVQASEQFRQVSKQVSDAVGQARTQIKTWLDQLTTSSGGGRDPLGRLTTARSQFDEQLTKARGGDMQALQSITTYAQRLLENAGAYYGTGTEYQAIRQWVESTLAGLPDQVDQLEAVRREIAKLNSDNTALSTEQQTLLDQLTNLRTVALSQAVQDADRNATDAAAAIAALQGATNTALTTANQVAGQVVQQLGLQSQTLTATQTIAGNTQTSAANTAASTQTMASMLTVLQSSFNRMGDLGQIMAGVGSLVAANTNHRQSVWDGQWPWLYKITANTGGTVAALGGMPAYASGTDWHPGGRAIVGEAGAEVIDLPAGARVTPVGRYSPPRAPAGSIANDGGAGLVLGAGGTELRLVRAIERQGEILREIAEAIDAQTDTLADGQDSIAARVGAASAETATLVETLKRNAGRRRG